MPVQYFGRGTVGTAQIADDSITDDDIAAHTSTKITITDKAQLNDAILYNDVDNTLDDGIDIAVGTTTGTKIGTDAAQKIGFYDATPVVQQATIADIDTGTINSGDGATDTVIGDIRTKMDTLLAELEALGLLASA